MTQAEEESVKRVIAMAAIREIATLRIRVWDGGDGFVLDFPDIPHTTVPKNVRPKLTRTATRAALRASRATTSLLMPSRPG